MTDDTERTPDEAPAPAKPSADEGWADMEGYKDAGYEGPEDDAGTGIPSDDDASPFDATTAGADTPGGSPEDPPPTEPRAAATPVPDDEAAPADFRERAKLLPDHDTWLERPSTIRLLKIAAIGLLAATVAAEAVFVPEPTAHFEGIDGWLGFHALYGFVTCVLMVLGAKFVLGAILKRKDTYYDG